MRSFIIFLALISRFAYSNAQRVVSYPGKTCDVKIQIDSVSTGDKTSYDCRINLVLVYEKTEGKLIQTITPPGNVVPCKLPQNKLCILQDINFDGFTDLMLPQEVPVANIPYYYWRFNEKTKQFQRDTTLEDITSPEFNPDKKTITSYWKRSESNHGISTYQYMKGDVTLVEETEISPDPENAGQQIFTRKKLMNGELKQVEETVDKIEMKPAPAAKHASVPKTNLKPGKKPKPNKK